MEKAVCWWLTWCARRGEGQVAERSKTDGNAAGIDELIQGNRGVAGHRISTSYITRKFGTKNVNGSLKGKRKKAHSFKRSTVTWRETCFNPTQRYRRRNVGETFYPGPKSNPRWKESTEILRGQNFKLSPSADKVLTTYRFCNIQEVQHVEFMKRGWKINADTTPTFTGGYTEKLNTNCFQASRVSAREC
jgi:hypothetical protein